MSSANHEATGHKIAHNITTICNIPLALWFMYAIFTLSNAPYLEFKSFFTQPVNMVAAVLFVFCTLKHFALEIEVVFEDYISNVSVRHFIILAMKLLFLVLGLAAALSILKLGL